MKRIFHGFTLFALFGLGACSTVIEGASQKITVASSPPGAECLLKQADDIVGRVTTPGSAEIPKSKNDLVVFCHRDGYESVSVKNRSDMAITGLGNAVFGQFSFLGSAVDSASGASNKYDSNMFVTLARAETPVAFPTPPGILPPMQLPMQTVADMSIQPPIIASVPATYNPSAQAAMSLSQATLMAQAPQDPQPLVYAQAQVMADASSLRPPYEITH